MFFRLVTEGKMLSLLRNPIFHPEIETRHLAAGSAGPWGILPCCLAPPGLARSPNTTLKDRAEATASVIP